VKCQKKKLERLADLIHKVQLSGFLIWFTNKLRSCLVEIHRYYQSWVRSYDQVHK